MFTVCCCLLLCLCNLSTACDVSYLLWRFGFHMFFGPQVFLCLLHEFVERNLLFNFLFDLCCFVFCGPVFVFLIFFVFNSFSVYFVHCLFLFSHYFSNLFSSYNFDPFKPVSQPFFSSFP